MSRIFLEQKIGNMFYSQKVLKNYENFFWAPAFFHKSHLLFIHESIVCLYKDVYSDLMSGYFITLFTCLEIMQDKGKARKISKILNSLQKDVLPKK